ncbi:hypothetical protein ACMAZF_05625 [Psychrobium sp. nBUS_13]|uniref:hypothetical protein n=1 Tax=Psychrobium sp. nBUS_13 TaxID=3395319 RepID=UPI003EC052D9
MDQWKMMMAVGNECFHQQSWFDAEQSYYQAVDIIEDLWNNDMENIELLQAWIAGQHNLSSLFEQQGLECEALRYLTIPHQRVLSLINQGACSTSFHHALMLTAKITLHPLLEFSQRHPICDGCITGLKLSKEWLSTPAHQFH